MLPVLLFVALSTFTTRPTKVCHLLNISYEGNTNIYTIRFPLTNNAAFVLYWSNIPSPEAAALAKAAATAAVKPVQPAADGTPADGTPATEASAPVEATPTPVEPTPVEPTAEAVASASDAESHSKLIHDLAVLVYANGDERLRARTMLMHIFHHALHDR